jgi:hypothetical protein
MSPGRNVHIKRLYRANADSLPDINFHRIGESNVSTPRHYQKFPMTMRRDENSASIGSIQSLVSLEKVDEEISPPKS